MSQPAPPSKCVVETLKAASPETVLLGEQLTVTMQVKAVCPPSNCPLDIVLVLEGSDNMVGAPQRVMQEAAVGFVTSLKLEANPTIRVGVVEYNHQARRLSWLTNSTGRVVGALRQVGADGGVRIDLGIQEGLKTLIRGRAPADGCRRQVMIVLARSPNLTGCEPVLEAARQAKGQGVLVITICFDGTCDAPCMRRAAISTRWHYQATGLPGLVAVFEQIRKEIEKGSRRPVGAACNTKARPWTALVRNRVSPRA